jgi:hypothetical protein
MVQILRKVRIFVASPGDVSDERARLARVVTSLSKSGGTAESLGLTLELLGWETHVFPDVGRPQGIVFDQLNPQDWDIFVGVLWTRFGTKTGGVDPVTGEDYQSGTEEEFGQALRLRKSRGVGWPKIMFYRCVRPVSLLRIDAAQFGRVQEFFKQFEPDGKHPGLTLNYTEPEEFERLVREHLEGALREYAKKYLEERRDRPDPSGVVKEGEAVINEDGSGGLLPPPPEVSGDVSMPASMFRYMLDQYFPRIHTWLTRIGLFKRPPEWRALHDYLSTLRSSITDDIRSKTYVAPPAKAAPDDLDRPKPHRTGFLTPIQQMIKEIVGVSHGGDAQSAQISAISKKSKFVGNLVKRLLEADEPLILLGDPGTGKSITLQQAAMLIAEKESKRIFPNVCLFVRLGEFQASGEVSAQTVWDYVKRSTPPGIRPFLDGMDDLGRLVIFFDGMDEMSRERYNEYTRALSVFAGSRKERHTKTLFSCRITDFTPRFQHRRLVLLPFGRQHIYKYLVRQISFPIRIGGKDWSARQLANRLARGGLPMQADNPFVLWLLCTFLQEEGDWPESRVHLLEYYSRYNYERKARDASRAGGSLPEMNAAFLTWGRIAYEITNRNKGAAISLGEVESFLTSEQLPAVQAGMQCGVLQKSLDTETTLIRFEHHRFQEYFTAYYLNEDSEEKAKLDWLDKLDAPRWQETLFNLVLMGGGHEALVALGEAIERGLALLKASGGAGETPKTAGVETRLADRVELAARVLQQTQQQPDETLAGLSATFRDAVYRLSDHGNPITKVKMLWASKIVPGIDIFRVAREALASNVAWVRQQALIITSVVRRDVGEGALQEDLLHSFASGRFLNRLGGYVRIASALKQKRLWAVLLAGFALTMLQLLACYGLVATVRRMVVPTFSAAGVAVSRFDQRVADSLEREALENNDEKKLERAKERREFVAKESAQWVSVASAAQDSLDSWLFLLAVAGAMMITFLYTLRRTPGHHFLTLQITGVVLLLLPLIWWPLWLGHWLILFFLVLLLLPFFMPLLSTASWTLTLLIQVFTLILFIASTFHWAGPIRKHMLFEAMWENCGFRDWGKKIKVYGQYPLLWGLFYILVLTSIFYWNSIRKFVVAACGLFPSLPLAVNIALSFLVYAEIIGLLVALVLGRGGKREKRGGSLRVFVLWTARCLALSGAALLIWGLSSINWQAVWQFILVECGLFSSLPSAVNVALSLLVYGEIAGLLVALASRLIKKRGGRVKSLEVFKIWTVLCLVLSAVVLLIWGLTIVNWQLIASTLGLLSFLPPAVDAALSVAIYVEIIGLVVALVSGIRRKNEGWSRGLKVLKKWSALSLGLVAITFLVWGSYTYSDYLARLLAIIIFSAPALALLVLFSILLRDAAPYLVVLRGPIRRARFNSASWKQELRNRDPEFQAALLRRTTPETLDLPVGDFLTLLQEVENSIKGDPAQSAYWAKRQQIEQIIRQERIG